MNKPMKSSNLQSILGVGPSIEKDLISIGINNVKDLRGKNPESLYLRLSKLNNKHIDRCVLSRKMQLVLSYSLT